MRMPVLTSTLQLVVVNLYTKYEDFNLNGSGVISLTKRCYRLTEGQTDGRTDRCKPV